MENSEFPLLKISNIKWVNNKLKKLPNEINLQWNSKYWNYDQVVDWLVSNYNCNLIGLNIKQDGFNKDKGCACC